MVSAAQIYRLQFQHFVLVVVVVRWCGECFLGHTLDTLIPMGHFFNATVSFSISSSRRLLSRFRRHTHRKLVLKDRQTSVTSPSHQHRGGMRDLQHENLHQLHDAIMSPWTRISKEGIQSTVKSTPMASKNGECSDSKRFIKEILLYRFCG